MGVKELMGPKRVSKSARALDGVNGVQLVTHSPFQLEEISLHSESNQSTFQSLSVRASQHLMVKKVWEQRPAFLRPIHCSCNGDKNLAETVANVVTSIPFVVLGIKAPKKNLNCRLYANSLIGVGIASSLYHSSRGTWRKYLRLADYIMIATSTVCLSMALRAENPKLLMAASAAFLPVQPLMVSAVHTGMMEIAFAKRAVEDPNLRLAHNVHKMSSLLGGALFIADEMYPQTPYVHAAWHLAAAVGVGTCNKLLEP